MPILGLGLHVIVALYFGIHAIRNRQNMYWLMILFMFPLLGSIVYFFAIYLPELRYSRGGQVAKKVIKQLVDPNRELREARQAFDLTPTLDKRLRLAAALMETAAVAEALQHYQEAAQGPFARDPAVLAGLARAQFDNALYAPAAASLQTLFEVQPDSRRQPAPALLHARTLAALGQESARDAFEAALVVASDPEPKCRYADWLSGHDHPADQARASHLYQEIVLDSRHWHSHAKSLNKQWLQQAQAALNQGKRS
ncbi:hypothetical protein [Chitinimonas sp. JJ19]|uniref:hypothetical protein n=1 Tax=Chitinimonas sp. JJ19 TaxID=3109352 RepID=UPI001A5F45A2|nr:hypothetical protein [Chitinimonas sp.]